MSPVATGIVVVIVAGAAGALYGALSGGTVVSGIGQGAALAGIGGLITGMLNPEVRDGAFAVGGVGLLTELLVGIGQGVYAYMSAPKSA